MPAFDVRLFLVAGVFMASCTTPYEPHGTIVDPPKSSPEFVLDAGYTEITRHDLEGLVTVVFFGFTHCPDICPDTMGRLARALGHLDERDAERVQGLFISLDPDRDSGATAARYASVFGPSFRGGVADAEELSRVAADFGIYYEMVPLGDDDNYTIDHSPYTFVLNPSGETVLIWAFGITDEQMLDDLRYILKKV